MDNPSANIGGSVLVVFRRDLVAPQAARSIAADIQSVGGRES